MTMDLKALVRDIPDFPEPGILYRDITPLLADPDAINHVTERLAERYRGREIDKIVGIESRGFIFGVPLACVLGIGFVPARKPGKLPYRTLEESYALEYGSNTLSMHEDALEHGERVLVIDDLLATGGTLAATCWLVRRLGGEVAEAAVLIELTDLEGRQALDGQAVFSLIQY